MGLIIQLTLTGGKMSAGNRRPRRALALDNKLVGKNAKLFKSISKISLAGVIMSLSLLPGIFIGNSYVALAYAVAVGGAVYIGALLALKAVGEGEMKMLPLGRKLSKALRRVGYYKGDAL